jgi:hypothetical protein
MNLEPSAMPVDLERAFALIREYKQGDIIPGADITDQQIELLRLLCGDLLPTETFSIDRLSDLVMRAAHADTLWNRRTQYVVSEIYSLKEANKNTDAEECRREFLAQCPSVWYRDIVEAV